MSSTPSTGFSRPLEGLRVLGVSPTPTHPTIAGNRARYRALLDRLESLGATVRVVHIGHEAGDISAMRAHWSAGGAVELPFTYPPQRHARWNRFARRIRRYLRVPLPLRDDLDDWCDRANAPLLQNEVDDFQPHAILMVYIWNSLLLSRLAPGILRVLDAQDVFTDRNERMKQARIPMQWFSVPRREEKRGLDRFDVVLAIQEQEAAFYRSLTNRPVVTVGHVLPIVDARAPSARPHLLIVGSDNPINIDGVGWFLSEVWPRIIAARPDARVQIVGRVCNHLAGGPGVTLHGPVDDLLPIYADSALVVTPLRGGTGLKIKTAEALAAGRVVVSTPSAAEGLEAAIGRGLVVAADGMEMASLVDGLLGDAARLRQLSAEATGFALEWNQRYTQSFDQVFAPLVASRGEAPFHSTTTGTHA